MNNIIFLDYLTEELNNLDIIKKLLDFIITTGLINFLFIIINIIIYLLCIISLLLDKSVLFTILLRFIKLYFLLNIITFSNFIVFTF
jgi:hypothetical protein